MLTPQLQQRHSFATTTPDLAYPDFLDIQLRSFREFFQLETKPEDRESEGLFKVFNENFPITDTRNQFVLEFLDYFIDPPRYSIEECIERGLTYSVPLKAKLKLYCTDPEHEDFETIVQDVYLGTIPYMTPRGSFVVNGAERIIVNQLHRSPGVFFGQSRHANGTKLYSARIIPFKGSWIEFATDINSVMYAYIDRKKKLPVTTLLRSIGYESDRDILGIFDLAEEVKVSKAGVKRVLGRRLAARVLKTWIEDFVDEDTGEVVSIERNELVLDRDTVLERSTSSSSSTPVRRPSSCTRRTSTRPTTPSSTTPSRRTRPTRRRRPWSTSTASCGTPSRQTWTRPVASSTSCSSASNGTTSVRWAVSGSTGSSASTWPRSPGP